MFGKFFVLFTFSLIVLGVFAVSPGDNTRNTIEVKFVNPSENADAILTWVSHADGGRAEPYVIKPNSELMIKTYLGHRFDAFATEDDARDPASVPLGTYLVKNMDKHDVKLVHMIVQDYKGADASCDGEEDTPEVKEILASEPALTQIGSAEFRQWADRAREDDRRIHMLTTNSANLPKFTAVGYKKSRVPDELFKRIREFWESHPFPDDPAWYRENWNKDDPNVNHWATDFYVLPMPKSLRDDIEKAYRDILAAWASVEADTLEMTSLYGIRRYLNGSVLANHVDRSELLVLSCITNVAQEVEEPWYLEVVGFDGVRTQIEMAPGDLVYYESATVPHGRPDALNGAYYDNFFTHYKPSDWCEINEVPTLCKHNVVINIVGLPIVNGHFQRQFNGSKHA